MPEVEPRPEEQERADLYALLAALLLGPDARLVEALAVATPPARPQGELEAAWAELLQAAARRRAGVLDEFATLFTSTGNPRIDPYQCRYLTGCLMDRPLAILRQDLHKLGLRRAAGATELEDHLGALCEAMSLLIRQRRPFAAQQSFFATHLANWSRRCLLDLAGVPEADFYRALARLAMAFFRLEEQVFAIDEAATSSVSPIRSPVHAHTNS